MTLLPSIAVGFGVVRGIQLSALTVPWVRQKLRREGITESEHSLVMMTGSRSIVLGLGMIALAATSRLEALGWLLAADAALQLFDTFQALLLPKRLTAILPAALCLLDALAAFILLA
jgi:hypothetical protein